MAASHRPAAIHGRHGHHAGGHHPPPPSAAAARPGDAAGPRGGLPLPPTTAGVENELRFRSGRRAATGRHYSGGLGGVGAGGGVPNGVVPTTTTVARRRHRSDDRRCSVVVDLLTETPTNAGAPDPSETVAKCDSSKADAGDATTTPVADRKSDEFTGVSSTRCSAEDNDDSAQRTVDVARLPEVARRGRLFAKRYRRRLVLPTGVCNVSFANVHRRGARLLLDIFTTLLEMKWRYDNSQNQVKAYDTRDPTRTDVFDLTTRPFYSVSKKGIFLKTTCSATVTIWVTRGASGLKNLAPAIPKVLLRKTRHHLGPSRSNLE